MKKKKESAFVCQECGYSLLKWMGRCPNCGVWNSFVEEKVISAKKRKVPSSSPVKLSEIESSEYARWSTNIAEFDRVLGGGIVPGTIILIGGEPGIGKSTLLIKIASNLSEKGMGVLYVSGEESSYQIGLRVKRLGLRTENLFFLSETAVENITEAVKKVNPSILIVDSIQTMFDTDIGSSPGSVSQVKECTTQLTRVAKEGNITIFLVGHVTKVGMIAGPRTLEHMVDTVLYLEGDRTQSFRILRAVKNRFGSINEIGVFEMTKDGLIEVKNPSMMFIDERTFNTSGSVVVSTIEGTRPILAEVQALVSPTRYPMPQRIIAGSDYKRFSILLAVLERRAGYNLGGFDVFCNVVGGLKLLDPSCDLGILVAVASNFDDRPCDNKTVVIGEVGLAGEVRPVSQIDRRVKEAERLGFTRCIIPAGNKKGLLQKKIKTISAMSLKEAIEKSNLH
ncbi:DNA repair protein RadA [candidate division WOR-3 bacterium]|nr:DNA repair protein RadA [candidate division WOR-3 bacterium]